MKKTPTIERKFFGTDGIRGTSNSEPMTSEIALKVGIAAGAHLMQGKHRNKAVIGKDTRLSGYMLEPALTSGLVAMGIDVILVGPMPTPGVAMLTRSFRADLGIMLSASHNPYSDNGIKLFDNRGIKLSDEVELEIEKRMQGITPTKLAEPSKLGRAKRIEDAVGRYIEFVKHTLPKQKKLNGLKVVLDCANGAAYKLGPTILWELEADVIPIFVTPNGFNINDHCGSTDPKQMCEEVIKQNADIGIALDGDADRIVICDEKGNIVDGDQLLAFIAKTYQQHGKLTGNGIVSTIMSNMGLEHYLNARNLELARTQVGDRYVANYMRENGFNIGGEQSGHIIFRDHATTGDGILAAIQILSALVDEDKPASEVFKLFDPLPQYLKNVQYHHNDPLNAPAVKKVISEGEKTLGKEGRLVIRKSGTEPLIRIMVEGTCTKVINTILNDIASEINKTQK